MIFISGGGNYKQTALLDNLFFRHCKRVLYVPIGLKKNFAGYEGCWEWFCQVCGEHDFCIDHIDMQLYLDDLDNLEQYNGIYIGGSADIKWLSTILKKSGFDSKLNNFVLSGGDVYGGSAGGILLGQTLDLQGGCGLGILPFSVLSHYSGNDSKISSYFMLNSNPLIVLGEDSGIIYEDNKITSVGYSPARVYFTKTNYNVLGLQNSIYIS